MSKKALRKARWAAVRGDFATAGDMYRLAGELERALKMYDSGGLHRPAAETARDLGQHELASELFQKIGQFEEAAQEALSAGQTERAARLFADAGHCLEAARLLEPAGRVVAAAALYERAGDHASAARMYLKGRQAERAARALEAASENECLDAREDLLALASRLAELLGATGDEKGAAKWHERIGRPLEAARAYERAGDASRAIRAYLEAGLTSEAADLASSTPPGGVEPRVAADAFRAAERWAEAASHYVESGGHTEAAFCLEQLGCVAEAAWAHEAAGDPIAAAESLEQAGDLPAAAELFATAGAPAEAARCLEAAGDVRSAAARYGEAGLRLDAARLFEQEGELDAAVSELQSVPSESRDAANAAARMGRIFERTGRLSLAAEEYRRALADDRLDTTDDDLWYRFGRVLERLGRSLESAEAYRRALEQDPRHERASARLRRIEAAPASRTTTSDETLPHRYKIESELALTLPGSTVLAHDAVMDRAVLLRRIGPELLPNERAARRLLADVRKVARLHHPAIAAVHDAGRDGDGIFVVQEYRTGRTLKSLIDRRGRLDVPTVVRVVTHLAEALDYAHGLGLLARTLRPANVVLTDDGSGAHVVDFGMALRHTDIRQDAAYRTPEACRGERMDSSSDTFSLGLLAWEMLHGAPPPRGEDGLPQLDFERSPAPEMLKKLLGRCLSGDPAERIGSAQEVLEQLHGTSLLPGVLLANRYEIRDELGRGGMGTVFSAHDLVLDEPVALKVLKGPLDETAEKRFIQEIRLARQISHPNVVRVHTFDRWRDLRFIVMEYIDGVDLRSWIDARGEIPLERVVELAKGIASGLAAAHAHGIVHRDVKPENILVDGSGRPLLVDFGIARQGDVNLTTEGLVVGSPAYMAPEQIRGEEIDHRADLYALGVIAYLLVSGFEPYSSENVAEVLRMHLEATAPPLSIRRDDVPDELERIVGSLLSKSPSARPADAARLIEELENCLAAPLPALA